MSAYEIPGFSFSLPSDTDLSVKATSGQFRFGKINSSGEWVVPSAGGTAIGVRQNNPKAGEATTIVRTGIVFVEASEAIAIGDPISTTVNGRAQVAAGGESVLGMAMTAAGGAGELCSVLLSVESSFAASGYSFLTFDLTLSALANGDVVTSFPLAFAGTIKSVDFVTNVVASTAAKLATLNLELGATNVTGGVVSLTTVSCNTVGKVTAGTAVTAANSFVAGDLLSIEASGVTTFIEGSGTLIVTVQSA